MLYKPMKKFLGMITMITALLLLTGCGNTSNPIDDNLNKWEATTLNDCKKGCNMLTNETIKTEDCYKLCETSQKLESNDINDCEKIDETSGNFITRDICIQDKAIQAKKPEYCEKINDATMKDTCYMWLVWEIKDKTVCENIKEEAFKSACLSQE